MAMAGNDTFAPMRRQGRAWIVGLLLIACVLGTIFMVSGWPAVRSLLGFLGVVFAIGVPTLFLAEVWFLARMIPARPELTPALGEPIPADFTEIDGELASAGFERVGGLCRLNTQPRTLMLNYVNRELGAYGTLQRALGLRPVCALISPRADVPGELETLGDVEVDALVAPAGTLRQILPDAAPAELVAAHRRAMADLRVRGVTFRHVSASELDEEVRDSMLQQRQLIRARPFFSAAVLNWRATTGRYPNLGSLSERDIRISS